MIEVRSPSMSNRRKLKGYRATHSVTDEIAKIANTFAGRYNAYTCEKCGKAYLTLDVDPGTTPMFMACYATEGCDGEAVSAGYPEGEPPAHLGDPIIHWVRPTERQFEKLSGSLKQHVVRGGLIPKATEATPNWAKELL
jgi:hypothetical protein